jgi:tRNA A37 threonylcarbamoyladenosine biosynthesis protein TsaE
MEGRERAFLLDGGIEWMHEGGIAAVEWAERVEELLPAPRLHVAFEHESPSARSIRVSVVGKGERSAALERIVRELSPFEGLQEVARGG